MCRTKPQSSMSLAFVRGIHQWLVNSPHKGPVMFPFADVIMTCPEYFSDNHKSTVSHYIVTNMSSGICNTSSLIYMYTLKYVCQAQHQETQTIYSTHWGCNIMVHSLMKTKSFAWMEIVRSDAIITGYIITWYCIHHCSPWGQIWIKLGHTKYTPHLVLMGELWNVFCENFG